MHKTTVLVEGLDLSAATLDRETFSVRQRVICAGWSANGRYYSDAVLQAAAPLLDGCRTFSDHPTRSEQRERPERRVRDITGYLRDPEYRDGALWATRHVIGEARHWLWALIVEVIEGRAPDLVACSINALGTAERGEIDGRAGWVVESIQAFNSVDDVATAAAGGGYHALTGSAGDDLTGQLLAALTFDEWRDSQPDYVERLKNEWKQVRQTEALRSAAEETEALRTRLAETETALDDLTAQHASLSATLESTRRELSIREALATVRLPAAWKADLRGMLHGAEPEQWAGIIAHEEQKAALAGVRPRVTVTSADSQVQPTVIDAESLSPLPYPDEDVAAWLARVRSTRNVKA